MSSEVESLFDAMASINLHLVVFQDAGSKNPTKTKELTKKEKKKQVCLFKILTLYLWT